MPTLVFSGYFGAGNAGDEAILSSLLMGLASILPDAEFVVLSRCPERTRAAHGVGALYYGIRRDLRAKLRLFRRADILISSGGLWQDLYPPRRWPRTMLYHATIALLASACGCRTAWPALGVGPLRSGWSRRLALRTARKADYLTVRDPDSAALLGRCGYRAPITVTADPALLGTAAWAEALPSEKPPLDQVGYLVIVVRPWPDLRAALPSLAAVADRALESWELTPVFVPMASGCDPGPALEVRAKMRQAVRAVILPELSLDRLRKVLGGADLVLSMRLHALVLAALSGVPPIGLAVDPKLGFFLDRLGLPQLCCRPPFDPDRIWQAMTEARNEKPAYRLRMEAAVGTMQDMSREEIKRLADLAGRRRT